LSPAELSGQPPQELSIGPVLAGFLAGVATGTTRMAIDDVRIDMANGESTVLVGPHGHR